MITVIITAPHNDWRGDGEYFYRPATNLHRIMTEDKQYGVCADVSRAAELIQDVVGFIGRVPGTGVPCYDETLANKVRAMGIPCFCCTPTLLPEFRAGALKGANLEQLAARLVKPEK